MKNKKEALCIVAHPDDETIWMGGTIMKNKDWNWTIISLCRKNDLDRAQKFRKVCNFYEAKSLISNMDDEKLKSLPSSYTIKKIKSILPKKRFNFVFTHGENGEYGHLRHMEIHKAVKKMIKNKSLLTDNVYYFSYELNNVEVFNKPRTSVRGTLRAQEICSQQQISVQQIPYKNLLASKKFPNQKNRRTNSIFQDGVGDFSGNFLDFNIPHTRIPSDLISNLNQKEYKDKINLITKFYGFQKNSFEALSCNKIETFTKS